VILPKEGRGVGSRGKKTFPERATYNCFRGSSHKKKEEEHTIKQLLELGTLQRAK